MPAGIAVSAFCLPEKTTWAFLLLGASVEVHVTNALPTVLAVMDAFQSSDVPVWKKNPLCERAFVLVFKR